MTFQIFKLRVLTIAFCLMATVSINAQQLTQMQTLIGQSLSKVNPSKPETMLNCIAELKRIDAMFPDSIQPKYEMALQSLNFSVMNPHAEQTENLLADTEHTINKMEQMQGANMSDVCTLRGFFYMVRIVQNPAQNGQRYYMNVIQNYEKALKINPDNQLAKQLQQKFFEGMKQAGR
ncbi:MAG: hypothetical protein IJK42_00905 [Prevotella sp.]|nr:hypothetical protein [Prevotella sp.]